uniref:Secreted protein n=1 Tax=Ascaris lumbricoides TaxID=6252 RepID=A0A0M3I0K2_ASCLU
MLEGGIDTASCSASTFFVYFSVVLSVFVRQCPFIGRPTQKRASGCISDNPHSVDGVVRCGVGINQRANPYPTPTLRGDAHAVESDSHRAFLNTLPH